MKPFACLAVAMLMAVPAAARADGPGVRNDVLASMPGMCVRVPSGEQPKPKQRDLLPPAANAADEPPLPVLSEQEKAYLMRFARRAMEHSIRTGKPLEASDAPATLADKDYITFVTCMLYGRVVYDSMAGTDGTITQNVANAAAAIAGTSALAAGQPTTSPDDGLPLGMEDRKLRGLGEAVIELNVCGQGQVVRWGRLGDVADSISPGVHGLAILVAGAPFMVRETAGPTYGLTNSQILTDLIRKTDITVDQIMGQRQHVTFYRFRAVHLVERPGGYVEMFRSAEPVPESAITAKHLDERTRLVGGYMLGRQMTSPGTDSDGLFSYIYDPSRTSYLDQNNAVHQAAAAWAMSRLAKATGDKLYDVAAMRAVGAARLRYLDDKKSAAAASYLGQRDRENLGVNAMVLLALIDLPDNKSVQPLRDALAEGILRLQRDDGSFRIYYNEAMADDDNRFFYPGEALLGLMAMHAQTGQARYLAAVEKAFDYHRNLFANKPNQGFAAWHCQVWAKAFEATGKKEYAEFVFQMADYLTSLQATPDNGRAAYPDLVGGFLYPGGLAGIDSALYVEGVAAAHAAAVKAGDQGRADRYQRSVRSGIRFVDQLIFKEADAYYCVSPKDVIGGVKLAPHVHTLRIDQSMQAVGALIAARAQLFRLDNHGAHGGHGENSSNERLH